MTRRPRYSDCSYWRSLRSSSPQTCSRIIPSPNHSNCHDVPRASNHHSKNHNTTCHPPQLRNIQSYHMSDHLNRPYLKIRHQTRPKNVQSYCMLTTQSTYHPPPPFHLDSKTYNHTMTTHSNQTPRVRNVK